MLALVVMTTSLDFAGRGILKCLGSNRPSSTEECEDHNLDQSPSSLKMLSLNKDISHRPVRTDFLRDVVYHNNFIVVSHPKYLENVILTNNVIVRCHEPFCLRVIQTSELEKQKGKEKVIKTAVLYENGFFPIAFSIKWDEE